MSCMIDNKTVKNLISEYGSPLYIFHEEEFIENYLKLLNTMRKIYGKYNIAYSYKTNYTPKIIEVVKELGGLAEVVSEMEYFLARKIGYEAKDIVYNGPVKGRSMFDHLKNGGIVNVDNLDELKTIVEFALKNKNIKIKLIFRANVDIKQNFVSRFGIDAYYEENKNSEMNQAFKMIKFIDNIKVVGLHCHVGRSRSLEAWKNRVEIMFKLIDRYFTDVPEIIDFGSGMNSVMEPELASQFGDNIPTFEQYAEIVAGKMKEKYGGLTKEKQPLLLTEPGTTVISGYMSFLGTVKSIKNVKNVQYVTFDCSYGNLGDISHLKNLPISIYPFGNERKQLENAIFVGYTCLEHDHIYNGYNGDLGVGDVIQFRNVGSYSNVFKPPFILPNCAMVKIDKNQSVDLIKRTETLDDIFKTYIF